MSVLRRIIKNKIIRVCFILLIITYPFTSDFRFFYATGDSMLPTYSNGELLVIYRSVSMGEDWGPSRGQVVIVTEEENGERLIKRVVGLEGEYVRIKNGRIHIDEKLYEDTWTHRDITYWLEPEEERKNKPEKEWLFYNSQEDIGEVPKGHVWVIGDNRRDSWMGIVRIKDIKGWVLF